MLGQVLRKFGLLKKKEKKGWPSAMRFIQSTLWILIQESRPDFSQ